MGCFEGEGKPSGDPDSWEGYASGVVEIQWRSDGQVSFPEAEDAWRGWACSRCGPEAFSTIADRLLRFKEERTVAPPGIRVTTGVLLLVFRGGDACLAMGRSCATAFCIPSF